MARYRIARVGRERAPEVDVENQQLGPLGAEVVGVKASSDDELVAALSGFDGVLNYGGRFPAESGYTIAFAMSGVAAIGALFVTFVIPAREAHARADAPAAAPPAEAAAAEAPAAEARA